METSDEPNRAPTPNHIDDNENLYRRIHPTFKKPDGSVSSQAFKDPEMSVDRALLRTPEESIADYANSGLVSFKALTARELEQDVVYDPILLNPAHSLVIGKKTTSKARKLAKNSEWIIQLTA